MSIATQQIRREDARVQTRLLKLLERDADWLFSLRLDQGMSWLDKQYGRIVALDNGTPTMRARLASSQLFWGWWNNQWGLRDQILERRLKPEQLESDEWVLAYWLRPEDELAERVFFSNGEFVAFYTTQHLGLANGLAIDATLIQGILRQAATEEAARHTRTAQQDEARMVQMIKSADENSQTRV